MIKIDLKRWIRNMWYRQTWFGYTYIRITIPGQPPVGNWHNNSSVFMKSFKKLTEKKNAEELLEAVKKFEDLLDD